MEIKILGVCGSPIKEGNTETLLRRSLEAAEATGGVKTEMITMAGKNIKDCRHCDWCLTKQEEGKFCAQQDDMTEIYPKALEADALLLASPVYIARLSGHMACFIDRLRVFAVGNLYHGKLRNKVGSALAVAWGRNLGLETTLLSIASGFMIMEMIVVGPPHGLGAPFGAAALSTVLDEESQQLENMPKVLNDDYGIKGAEALGKRVAEVAKLLRVGKDTVGQSF